MDFASMDFAQARLNMVDGQIRPNKVTDPRIVAAMLELPREHFVPSDRRALAYADEDVPLGHGRVLMEPMLLARLVQAAAPGADSRALVVAAGAGYGAALLARLCGSVVALEVPGPHADALAARVPGVTIALGPLDHGWAAAAPYDVILVEGAVEALPAALAAQLAEGGRLLMIRAASKARALGEAVKVSRNGASLTEVALFDAGTPLLPEFRRAPDFVF